MFADTTNFTQLFWQGIIVVAAVVVVNSALK